MTAAPLVDVRGLRVLARSASGPIAAVDGLDLQIRRGEIVGIIGESGSGKSTLVQALTGLLGRNRRITDGVITFAGEVVRDGRTDRFAAIRGSRIGMVFQHATGSLNPVLKVRTQLAEVLRWHTGLRGQAAEERMREVLTRLAFDDPERVLDSYPHQLSGGMNQRVAIALAIAPEPQLVIADECTSALDVTTQAEVVGLLRDLAATEDWALAFVTHDILLAAELCHRIAVLYGGQLVELGEVERVIGAPRHPYTAALLDAVPRWAPRAALRGIEGAPPRVRPGTRGCRFADRCPHARDECRSGEIAWVDPDGHGYRCVLPAGALARDAPGQEAAP